MENTPHTTAQKRERVQRCLLPGRFPAQTAAFATAEQYPVTRRLEVSEGGITAWTWFKGSQFWQRQSNMDQAAISHLNGFVVAGLETRVVLTLLLQLIVVLITLTLGGIKLGLYLPTDLIQLLNLCG